MSGEQSLSLMASKSDELPGALYELSSKILELTELDEVKTVDRPYTKRHFRSFGDELAGSKIHGSHDEKITKEDWHPESYEHVLEEISETDIYSECINQVDRRIGDKGREGEDLLEEFIRRILECSLDDASEREIMNQIHLFICYLDDSPVLWGGSSWIDGLQVEETIRLDEDVKIRPPTDDDLTIELPLSVARHGGARSPKVVPRSIVEFSERTNDASEVDSERDEILSTLLLYSVTSIAEIRWERESENFRKGFKLYSRFNIGRRKLESLPFDRTIEEDEIDELRNFFSTVRPLISDQIVEKEGTDFLTIAFDRYQNAIADDDSDESRLTSAIMCLEALLLGAEGELSDKLSRRTGILLGFFDDYHPIEVKNKIRSAYDIRSQYVHGSKIDEEEDISKLTYRILDYSRLCLVTFLQMSGELEKKQFLTKLDESALHEGPKESLKETISDTCEV